MKFYATDSVASNESVKNTKDKGIVEFTIFEEDGRYVGVCLTFDIVVEGESYESVRADIIDAAKVHIETVKKRGLSEDLLNRPAPKEYWEKRIFIPEREIGSERRSYSTENNTGLLVK